MRVPVITLIGRPNVGKSTLFNKLVGRRLAITSEVSGTTRDRLEGDFNWKSRTFCLVDTGGLCGEGDGRDQFYSHIKEQVFSAVKHSDVVVFVVDVRTGLMHLDEEISLYLKKSQKPVVLCVNKCDSIGYSNPGIWEFCSLGFGDPVAVSAVHGHGSGDLLDRVFEITDSAERTYNFENDDSSKSSEKVLFDEKSIKVAIVGKPNAGKSSLINKISNINRCIVTDIPGTTRDSLDVLFTNSFGSYTFIDTAGLRKRRKICDNIEKYSAVRSRLAIERSNICLLLVDATCGYSEQDSKIAELIESAGKGCIIVANKWDLVEKDSYTMQIYQERLLKDFSFVKFAPVLFVSAKTGQRLNDLFKVINDVYRAFNFRVSTGRLNGFLEKITASVPPPAHKGKRLKIFYITQVSFAPPTFVLFVNSKKLLHFSYLRYIENQLRSVFNFLGTPIRFAVREKTSVGRGGLV